MQVSVLACGSKGNAVFVAMDGVRLLIDAGISCRRIEVAQAQGRLIPHEMPKQVQESLV